jgi:hypothetical protein
VRAWGKDEGPATHMASALATTLPSSVDIGGVRCDEFRRLWEAGRDLYCIEQPDELRNRALRYLVRFRPEPRREGTFAVVKLVTVAAALRSVELHATNHRLAERLFRAAGEVATAWAASDGAESFYCAELVATAYGRTFVRAELAPPPIDDGLGDEIDEPRWLAWLMRMFSERVDGIDDARGRTWAMLFGLLSGDDLDFLQHVAVAVAASGGVALGHALEAVLEKLPGSRVGSADDSPFVPLP